MYVHMYKHFVKYNFFRFSAPGANGGKWWYHGYMTYSSTPSSITKPTSKIAPKSFSSSTTSSTIAPDNLSSTKTLTTDEKLDILIAAVGNLDRRLEKIEQKNNAPKSFNEIKDQILELLCAGFISYIWWQILSWCKVKFDQLLHFLFDCFIALIQRHRFFRMNVNRPLGDAIVRYQRYQ